MTFRFNKRSLGPMDLLPSRKGLPGLHRRLILKPFGIAERNNPGVVHHQEIQHSAQKCRICGLGAQIIRRRPRRAQKDRQQIVMGRQPA